MHRSSLVALLAVTVFAPYAAAQSPLRGFSATAQEAQATLEALLRSLPDTARARRDVWRLSGEARVAGTEAQGRSADYVLAEMAAAGLDTLRATYWAYLPRPDSTVVERLEPRVMNLPLRLALDEGPLPEDSSSGRAAWPAMNGFSGVGDARGDLLYVNYGLADDYRVLDSMGVRATGRVVVARYGRGYRGIKAAEAERHGAAALLLYSDPADDGYVRGDAYPAGPMRHFDAVERGSVSGAEGDPSTPGRVSSRDVQRVGRDAMTLPRIPVVPISYRNALQLLASTTTGGIPQAWQGGLPIRYHLGAGEVRVRVAVWADTGVAAIRPIHNTLGIIRGDEFPDEMVIVGAHRDAWGAGAADNASGVTSVLEAARAWGEAVRRGIRPRRTLVFATWDAEEWGLIGSTEWVEDNAERLRAKAVAYVNQDMVAHGPTFGIAASPSLQPFARTLAADVADVANATIGDLGSGSDFSPFQNGLGVPSLGYGFGGPHGGYHSAYDTPVFVERFGDPGFVRHAHAARIAAVALARLGNADVIPVDGSGMAGAASGAAQALRPRARSRGDSAAIARVEAASRELGQAASQFAKARDRRLGAGAARAPVAVNDALRRLDRAMVGSAGGGVRNLLVGSERATRYGAVRLPGLAEALADGDAARVGRESAALVAALSAAAAALREAAAAL